VPHNAATDRIRPHHEARLQFAEELGVDIREINSYAGTGAE
jgi:hypothetical protein